ncbi:MAG: alpha/beta hydrolase [Leptolyngbyaceae cyanobacterium SL_7_1]|nr:alpha/beta hydrolase [Leptolyngbyaceae cyanobacterium SL_7_1]
MVDTVEIRGVPHVYELTPPTSLGVVLVFVHGWLLSREYWQPVIEQLSPVYQCLSYDLRGFGESQCRSLPTPSAKATYSLKAQPSTALLDRTVESSAEPTTVVLDRSDDYRPIAYARDLLQLLQALNITNAWLIGHSLGGSIALWAADQQPSHIRGVICINSGGGIYLKEEFERFRSVGQQLVKLRPRWLCYMPLVDLMMTRMNVAHPIARRWGRKRLLDLVAADPGAALGTLLDSTTEAEVHRLPQVISRLEQPVHFIAGSKDDIMEPQYVSHLASFHPLFRSCGDNVVQIPDCGHLAMVEQPNTVAQQIQRIITHNQPSSKLTAE